MTESESQTHCHRDACDTSASDYLKNLRFTPRKLSGGSLASLKDRGFPEVLGLTLPDSLTVELTVKVTLRGSVADSGSDRQTDSQTVCLRQGVR